MHSFNPYLSFLAILTLDTDFSSFLTGIGNYFFIDCLKDEKDSDKSGLKLHWDFYILIWPSYSSSRNICFFKLYYRPLANNLSYVFTVKEFYFNCGLLIEFILGRNEHYLSYFYRLSRSPTSLLLSYKLLPNNSLSSTFFPAPDFLNLC